mgnify:CR=1 FL=1
MDSDGNPIIPDVDQAAGINQALWYQFAERAVVIDRVMDQLRLYYSPLLTEEQVVQATNYIRQRLLLEITYAEEISPGLN